MTAAQNLALAAAEMRTRDENAGDAFVALLARWTDPAGFESVRRQEEVKGTDEVVQGSARGHARSTPSCGTTAPRSPSP